MKGPKRPWTRRQRARRWTAAALLLLAAAVALHWIHLTPGQAMATAEKTLGTGETTVFFQKKVGNVNLYFSENDNVLLVTPFRLSLRYDWWNNGQPLAWADRSRDPGGICAVGLTFVSRDTGQELYQIFGLVPLEGAASIQAPDPRTTWPDFSPQVMTAPITTLPDGRQAFWAQYRPEEGVDFVRPAQLLVLDEAGQVIATYDMSQNWGGDYLNF